MFSTKYKANQNLRQTKQKKLKKTLDVILLNVTSAPKTVRKK